MVVSDSSSSLWLISSTKSPVWSVDHVFLSLLPTLMDWVMVCSFRSQLDQPVRQFCLARHCTRRSCSLPNSGLLLFSGRARRQLSTTACCARLLTSYFTATSMPAARRVIHDLLVTPRNDEGKHCHVIIMCDFVCCCPNKERCS